MNSRTFRDVIDGALALAGLSAGVSAVLLVIRVALNGLRSIVEPGVIQMFLWPIGVTFLVSFVGLTLLLMLERRDNRHLDSPSPESIDRSTCRYSGTALWVRMFLGLIGAILLTYILNILIDECSPFWASWVFRSSAEYLEACGP